MKFAPVVAIVAILSQEEVSALKIAKDISADQEMV
jgi:hypothetical protein